VCFSWVVSCNVCSTNVVAHDALLLDNRLSAGVKRERDSKLACGLDVVVVVVVGII
jgi:hypothetical protein